MTRGRRVAAYVGLGANLGQPLPTLRQATAALDALPGTRLRAASGVYQSAPLGCPDQPDYLNAVVGLETTLPAPALLGHLQAIERAHGRSRDGTRWGPRTLDLDLLLYGEQEFRTDALVVPHPGLTLRAFVLYPLREIAPGLCLPGGESLEALLGRVPATDLRRVDTLI